MIKIPLTRGRVAIVSDRDRDLATLKWQAGLNRGNWIAQRTVYLGPRKVAMIYLGRVVLERKLGRSLRRGELCDHKDGDGLNNRRSNVRILNHSGNAINSRQRPSATGTRYVYKQNGKFRVMMLSRKLHAGYYNTYAEAVAVSRAIDAGLNAGLAANRKR